MRFPPSIRSASTCSCSTRSTARATSTSTRPVGSIFSVLEAPRKREPASSRGLPAARRTQQLCAGYAIYGATTMLVLTLGRGVHGFTLDRGFGEFILTHPNMTIADGHERIRHQRLERALLGTAREALRGRMSAGPRGRARQGLQHALDRLAGRRGASDLDPRRAVHVSQGHQGCPSKARSIAAAVRGQPHGDARRTGGRQRLLGPRPGTRSGAARAAPARAAHPRVPIRGRADRALSSGARPGPRPHLQLAVIQRALTVHPERMRTERTDHVSQASHHRRHRLLRCGHDIGDPHVQLDLSPRAHQGRAGRGRFVPPLRPAAR